MPNQRIKQIDLGHNHTAFVTFDSNLYSFGENSEGQLGLGSGVYHGESFVDKPTRVSDIYDEIKEVSCGYKHTLCLTVNGLIYGMGSNRKHEMGLGDTQDSRKPNFFSPIKLNQLEIHNLIKVSAGGFSAALTDHNQVIIWGSGNFGVFNTPQKVCMDDVHFTDIKVSNAQPGVAFAAAVDNRGALFMWGVNDDG